MNAMHNGLDSSSPDANGAINESALAEALQEEATVGYRPQIPLETMWASGSDMPQITLRRDIEFMQFHPVVSTALDYYKSGISGAKFWGGPDPNNPDNQKGKPISPNPQVAQFVLQTVERFWQRGMPILQEGCAYGWAPGEHMYEEKNGLMCWSHLKSFHPHDGHILTCDSQPVGIRVKNIRQARGKAGGTVDLWFASNAIPAKAAWYAHRPRFGSFYGRSQLSGAWLPWRMLGWRDGMDQVINAAVYRAGYRGPIVKHPPGHSAGTAQQGVPATRQDGGGMPRREYRDIARQLVEWAKAGAGFSLSSEQYSQAQGGGPKWSVEWPDHVMDVRPLVEAARWCEDRIMLGIGVPPELIKASQTGSGYSGRSIPREAFLDGQQRVADPMLQAFVDQVVKPLVLWNYGDVPFGIQCKSLLESQADDKQGQQGGGQGGSQEGAQESRQQPGPQGQPAQQPQQPPAAFSLNSRVMDIVQRVIARRAA